MLVDVLVEATELGRWAFHRHILFHAESNRGMFGMLIAPIVEPTDHANPEAIPAG